MPDLKNVFISHIHEDDAELPNLKDLLQKHGCDVRDSSINSTKPNDATSEEHIKSQILAPNIRWARALIVLITPGTRDSKWVNWEIEYAMKQGKRIIGVWAHGSAECDVPEALDKYHDGIFGWNSGEKIAAAVAGEMAEPELADGTVPSLRSIHRYGC